MSKHPTDLSRRERQIMRALFQQGSASVADIAAAIPDPPTHTAIRTLLTILERKRQVRRQRRGRANRYSPVTTKRRAARVALDELLGTFFDDSLSNAVAAHLSDPSKVVEGEELDRIRELIDQARAAGR